MALTYPFQLGPDAPLISLPRGNPGEIVGGAGGGGLTQPEDLLEPGPFAVPQIPGAAPPGASMAPPPVMPQIGLDEAAAGGGAPGGSADTAAAAAAAAPAGPGLGRQLLGLDGRGSTAEQILRLILRSAPAVAFGVAAGREGIRGAGAASAGITKGIQDRQRQLLLEEESRQRQQQITNAKTAAERSAEIQERDLADRRRVAEQREQERADAAVTAIMSAARDDARLFEGDPVEFAKWKQQIQSRLEPYGQAHLVNQIVYPHGRLLKAAGEEAQKWWDDILNSYFDQVTGTEAQKRAVLGTKNPETGEWTGGLTQRSNALGKTWSVGEALSVIGMVNEQGQLLPVTRKNPDGSDQFERDYNDPKDPRAFSLRPKKAGDVYHAAPPAPSTAQPAATTTTVENPTRGPNGERTYSQVHITWVNGQPRVETADMPPGFVPLGVPLSLQRQLEDLGFSEAEIGRIMSRAGGPGRNAAPPVPPPSRANPAAPTPPVLVPGEATPPPPEPVRPPVIAPEPPPTQLPPVPAPVPAQQQPAITPNINDPLGLGPIPPPRRRR